jgi:hypothetical protein
LNELVVDQMRIRRCHAIEILRLARRQIFRWIQAPPASQKPLSAENLVDARDASVEMMCNVKERCIHVRHLCISQEPLRIDRLRRLHNPMEFSLQLHSASRPHCPMSKQTAGEPKRLSAELEPGDQVQDNMIVIARIESNLACAAGCSDSPQNILGGIAIEGSNLDPITLSISANARQNSSGRDWPPTAG